MGNKGAQAFGLEKAQITLEESIPGMAEVVCSPERNAFEALWRILTA
jgi:hypothetical protein